MINKKAVNKVKKADSIRRNDFNASAGVSKVDSKFSHEIGSGSQLPDIYHGKKTKKKKTQAQKERDVYVEQLLER
jgi:hypothetical protein